jgi:hypothetical protein
MPYTFFSPADFADFVKTHDICLVSKDGTRKRSVRALQEATIDTVGDYFLLMTPFDNIDEKVTNLQAHRKNSSNGQERATTLAIASCEQVRKEFGPLTLVGDGESITFSDSDGEKQVLEADGIIANTNSVLLNSVKHSPKVEDVDSLLLDKVVLEGILSRPSSYTSFPTGALEAMNGITTVKLFLSGYDFSPEVLEKCRLKDVHPMKPNGKDYSTASSREGLTSLRA